MLQLLNLQSRRLAVTFVLLAWAALLAMVGEARAAAHGGAAYLQAGFVVLLLAIVLPVLLAAACRVPALRGWRVAAEVGALAAFVTALSSALIPWLPGWAHVADFATVAGLGWALLYGPLADRLPWRLTQRDTTRIHVPLPYQMVWRMALPTRPSEHWDPLLRASVQDAEDADTFHLDYARTGGGTDAVTATMLEIEPNQSYRYLFQGESSGVLRAFAQGDQSVRLTPDGPDATWVELSRRTEARLPGQMLLSWLDRAPEDYARFLRDNAMGEEMSRTLSGLHRLAVLREELTRRRRNRAEATPAQSRRAALRERLHRMATSAMDAPSLMSW